MTGYRRVWDSWRPGILPRQYLMQLQKENIINCELDGIDPSSIDLHLSNQGWHLKGCLKLKDQEPFSVISNDSNYRESPLDLSSEVKLSTHETYVIQLKEHLKAENSGLSLYGTATGRSTVGRLDVLTRLMVDRCEWYDTVTKDYSGPLYVEVTPITFPIIVREGVSLNQLRLFRGEPKLSELDDQEVKLYGQMIVSERPDTHNLTLDLTPVLIGNKKVIAFTTKKSDLSGKELNLCPGHRYQPTDFWEMVPPDSSNAIKIERDKFYILRSKERFKLPPDVGVYCQAITENLGEIRIHYAGFVHPGFGYYRSDGKGTPLVFEVRGHTVDAFLRHGELMANVAFHRTSELVDFTSEQKEAMKSEDYNNQELQLSKYFEPWAQ